MLNLSSRSTISPWPASALLSAVFAGGVEGILHPALDHARGAARVRHEFLRLPNREISPSR